MILAILTKLFGLESRDNKVIKRYLVNKRDSYTIEFRRQTDGTITIFARDHPADSWGKAVTEHHLYRSGAICVAAGHEPRTLDRAKAIAWAWMEGYSEYVRTGTFPKGTKRYNV